MFDFLFQRPSRVVSEKVIYVNEYDTIAYSCMEDLLTNMNFGFNNTIVDVGHDMRDLKYYVIKNLAYSKYYRKLIQENDVDTLIELLTAESPSFVQFVDMSLFREGMSELKANISDFYIRRVPVTMKMIIGGITYNGAKSLKSASQDPKCKVSNRWEAFPCFDSFDYANENRCYSNYCFCFKDTDKWQKVMALELQDSNFCLVGEKMPKDVLPMVYVNDDEKTMLFARR